MKRVFPSCLMIAVLGSAIAAPAMAQVKYSCSTPVDLVLRSTAVVELVDDGGMPGTTLGGTQFGADVVLTNCSASQLADMHLWTTGKAVLNPGQASGVYATGVPGVGVSIRLSNLERIGWAHATLDARKQPLGYKELNNRETLPVKLSYTLTFVKTGDIPEGHHVGTPQEVGVVEGGRLQGDVQMITKIVLPMTRFNVSRKPANPL